MVKTKKRAFTLADTIIVLTVAAIAITASTPLFTRKAMNNADLGTSLTGGSHGRYEFFAKEVITFKNKGSFEKSIDPQKSNDVVLYERKTDTEYEKILKTNPKVSGDKKDLLYEEFATLPDETQPRVIPVRNDRGEISSVKFKRKANDKIYEEVKVGGRYIIENANIMYHGYDKNKKTHRDASKNLDMGTNRVIEGNLVTFKQKYNKNNLWAITIDQTNNYNGEVKTVPWLREYNGTSLVDERAIDGKKLTIKKDKLKYVKNATIHAVGGGGAGGGIQAVGAAVSPKEATQAELDQMKADLAKRFRTATGATWTDDEIVRVVPDKWSDGVSLYNKPYKNIFTDKNGNYSDKTYIVINKYDGTITVKVDIREGHYRVFPHQILNYTKELTTSTQSGVIYRMPVWGSMPEIANKGFYTAITGCGGRGGAGGGYTATTECDDVKACRKSTHCPQWSQSGYTSESYITKKGNCSYTCYEPSGCNGNSSYQSCASAAKIDYKKMEKEFGIVDVAFAARGNYNLIADYHNVCLDQKDDRFMDGCGSPKPAPKPCCYSKTCYTTESTSNCTLARACSYKCDGAYFACSKTGTDSKNITDGSKTNATCSAAGSCTSATSCPSDPCPGDIYKPGTCFNSYNGGAGGKQPKCAIACKKVGTTPIKLERSCSGDMQGAGGGASGSFQCKGKVSVTSGSQGRTCTMTAGDNYAYSIGGSGGSPVCVPKTESKYGAEYTDSAATRAYETALSRLQVGIGDASYYQGIINNYKYTCTYDLNKDVLCTSICGARTGAAGSNGTAQHASGCDPNTAEGLRNLKGVRLTWTRDSETSTPSDSVIENNIQQQFNHIYTWTAPYRTNRLSYGEAGEAGEYRTARISKIEGSIEIELGKGGAWANKAYLNSKGTNATLKGPDGTDTIVKISSAEVLRAKGGKGGKGSQKTNKYDLCYATSGTCNAKTGSGSINCCGQEKGLRTTKDIIATAAKYSLFENVKALTSNSTIIGIGAGRGGEGISTRANDEANYERRRFLNSSAYKSDKDELLNYSDRVILDEGPISGDTKNYNNQLQVPSYFNLKGGEGAVIIVW